MLFIPGPEMKLDAFWTPKMNSTEAVQAYRQRQKDKGRNQRALYATDAEFRAIKALLTKMREGE